MAVSQDGMALDLTYLVTDIEDSMALWEQDAAAVERLLARHDELLRHCPQRPLRRPQGPPAASTSSQDAHMASYRGALALLRPGHEQRLVLQ